MRPMRKQSRCQSADRAFEVLDKAPYITLSMVRPDGTPYGIPLNIARKDERVFYFHCADEGGENRLSERKSYGESVGREPVYSSF